MKLISQAVIAIILIASTLFVFEVLPIDMLVQSLFYEQKTQSWLWPKKEPIAKLFFYTGPKALLILFAVALVITLICQAQFASFFKLLKISKKRMIIVLLSLVIVPSVIGALKATTNGACPSNLKSFGGDIVFVSALASYPVNEIPTKKQRCFPAGHASGGFALMALFFLFKRKEHQIKALLAASVIGWIMGGYKMVIGDHFLSHTIITQLIAWTIICLIAFIVEAIASKNKNKNQGDLSSEYIN